MASQIPEDFGSEWDLSDVVLHTLHSDGKELHANKASSEKSIAVPCEYSAVKGILRVLYHMDADFSADGQKQFDANMLMNLYKAADMIDVPVVRKFCDVQMKSCPSVDLANAAQHFSLHDKLMDILGIMSADEVKAFLSYENKDKLGHHAIFSKDDVAVIYEKATGTPLVLDGTEDRSPEYPLTPKELCVDLEDPRIDLTKEWPTSNIALSTNDSGGKLLYSNKDVLAGLSPFFMKMFFEGQVSVEPVIHVDVEYFTMKEILSVIYLCDRRRARFESRLHPLLVYEMYLASSEENLDIPLIKDFCISSLNYHPIQQTTISSCLQMAVRMGHTEIKSLAMCYTDDAEMRKWILGERVAYLRDGKELDITTGSQELVFSAHEMFEVYEVLTAERY